MSKNKITLAIISAMMGFVAFPASANTGVVVVKSDMASGGMLTQVGTASGVMSPLKGFAKDLPLVSVMRQITPNGWKVKKIDNRNVSLDTNMLISWEGGESWITTLEKIVKQYPVNAVVHWDEKEITLSPKIVAKPVQPVKNSIFELDRGTAQDVTVGASQQDVATKTVEQGLTIESANSNVQSANANNKVFVAQENVVPPVVQVAQPEPRWNMLHSLSLKNNVIAWGREAGYKVEWIGEDYPVDGRELVGNFDSPTGPIKQLSVDYGPKSAVEKPLAFEFLQNGVLVVKNFRFEQAGFPQFNK